MTRLGALFAAAALAGCTTGSAGSAQSSCRISDADSGWLAAALAQWRQSETSELGLPDTPLPTVAAIDTTCTYLLAEGRFDRIDALPHGETVVLPDGAEVPLGPVAFASGEGRYFAMSLPSVWRAAEVNPGPFGLEALMTGVLLHEMMHVRQIEVAATSMGDATERAGVSDDELTDDIVQERFRGDPEFVAAWEAERDALFAAAAAPTDEEARVLAGKALGLMRERRTRWFTGDNAGFIEMDDVFLTMEGMGQWLIYRYFLEQGYSPEEVLPAVRRNGRWWSQDEGLGLMLTVDRLLPGWQQRAFRDPDWRAERLLAAAVAGPN